MELKLATKGSDGLEVEIEGEDISITQIVLDELWKEKTVAFAGVHSPHPLFRKQLLSIRTKQGDPYQTFLAGITRAEAFVKELQEALKAALEKGRT